MTTPLTYTIAQINPIVGDLAYNLDIVRRVWKTAPAESDLIIFPELSLTGYIPEDLLYNPSFLDATREALETLRRESINHRIGILIGSPYKDHTGLYNAVHVIAGGKILATRTKHDLPNYGIFDEKRYFTAGQLPEPVEYKDHKLGIMICEDMWYPDVADHLKKQGAEILIVANGSPFETHKPSIRLQHATLRVEKTGLPLIYVNQVGGQDDLVFDGASFMLLPSSRFVFQSPQFEEDIQTISLEKMGKFYPVYHETEAIYKALTMGLHDYVEKNKIGGVLIGMSGGIDSALSATIAVDALGPNRVRSVMMPSVFTSADSLEDAADCAAKLGILHTVTPISSLVESFTTLLPDTSGLAHENLQARLRGLILMSQANQNGWMVLSTGNKSELSVGYATLYGDMCGGYNVLKDTYKTQVYALARWRNDKQNPLINERILTKAPTAELKPNQTDQDTLPPYDILDPILMDLVEGDMSPQALIDGGQNPDTVRKVVRMLTAAEHKRRQAAPGPKVSSRAFGRERRYPITNGFFR